jgi:hypothetical protein
MANIPNREATLRAIYADRSWHGEVTAIYSPACRTCGQRAWAAQNNLRGGGFKRGGFYCTSCENDGLMVVASAVLVSQIEDALVSQRPPGSRPR